MHNNYYFLKHLAVELNQILIGKELLICFSQDKDEVVLGFSNDRYLKCILKTEFSTLQLIEDFNRARKNTVSLWPELYGLAVKDISVFENERAIKIVLDSDFTIVIKLFGNRPNLLIFKEQIFVSMFNNKLLSDKKLELKDFDRNLDFSLDRFKELNGAYRKIFPTFGKDLFEYIDLETDVLSLEEVWGFIQKLFLYLDKPTFYVLKDAGLPKLSLLRGEVQANAVLALNTFVSYYQRVSGTDKLKFSLTNKLKKEIDKTMNYVNNTQSKLDLLISGTKNEEIGNILMANIYAIPIDSEEVVLHNFYTDEPVKIRIKSNLSPQKNAEVYYRKSKNEKIEIETTERNLKNAQEKLITLKNDFERIENVEEIKELRGISKEIIGTEKKAEIQDLPFKEYLFKGIKIWVGRNAKNNDLLTTKHAHKDEWWLHAKDVSGSHVVIKHMQPSIEVLEYAASLAAYYSKRKTEGLVTVIYTQKKYVRKTNNLLPGQVVVDREKTLLVEPAKF